MRSLDPPLCYMVSFEPCTQGHDALDCQRSHGLEMLIKSHQYVCLLTLHHGKYVILNARGYLCHHMLLIWAYLCLYSDHFCAVKITY